MGKNLPHMGPFTMSFEAEHIHPGVALIKEILQTFEDFMFLRLGDLVGSRVAAREHKRWETEREEALWSIMGNLNKHRLSKDLRVYMAHRLLLMNLIQGDPKVWEEFKKNCMKDSMLGDYIEFILRSET
ncbi:MAG: hypothetical protein A2648_01495 [Candidatus Lloydbacteria bacterium RIFCSPHIGHO2_01_FULL_41_20]|uniref:Uncharacterized protein n=1 Tax=Candidatus Lloydbacteria bacterium RIFCSPHIGHO2_01_FULL_41_20 TaxID=1798657 RepID=A0A1G2CSX6_9BACT|nr:MAG: hypothetical protein A2648_01495 [Candidatus Lloydbacteria bacterium RIFCSPHIGHO2_01_FULL_41_20]